MKKRKKTWRYKKDGDLFWFFKSTRDLNTKDVSYWLGVHRDRGYSDGSFHDRWFKSIEHWKEREFHRYWEMQGRGEAIAAILPHLSEIEREEVLRPVKERLNEIIESIDK